MPFRIRKVVGSIPIRSTKMEIAAVFYCGGFCLGKTNFGSDHREGCSFSRGTFLFCCLAGVEPFLRGLIFRKVITKGR